MKDLIPTPTSVPVTASEVLGNCPKCGSYLQRRLDGSIGCQPCDVRELPTPPDLEKETEWLTLIKCTCSLRDRDFSKGGWIPNHDLDCALTAKYHLGNELSHLRAELQQEREKKNCECGNEPIGCGETISQLRAENERLKAALREIDAITKPSVVSGAGGAYSIALKCGSLARAALSGSSEKGGG